MEPDWLRVWLHCIWIFAWHFCLTHIIGGSPADPACRKSFAGWEYHSSWILYYYGSRLWQKFEPAWTRSAWSSSRFGRSPHWWTDSELNSAISRNLCAKSLMRALGFLLRDVMVCINTFSSPAVCCGLRALYLFWQSIVWTGLWTKGASYLLIKHAFEIILNVIQLTKRVMGIFLMMHTQTL